MDDEESVWNEMQSRILSYLDANNISIVNPKEEQDKLFSKMYISKSPVIDSSKQRSSLLARRKTYLMIKPLSMGYK